jgi:hypothetical protein
MATAAQVEANRRNSQKSTGPRTDEGKNRSRMNALDHGCRAHVLVLPSEEFGAYENECRAWKLSFKPRNPAEEFLIEGIVSMGCLTKRIEQAHTARLTKRMHYGIFEEDAEEEQRVIELGQKLFRDATGVGALHLQDKASERQPGPDGEPHRVSDNDSDEDHPRRLVSRLKACGTGCEWLLGRWHQLRERLERGTPWLAPDKLKAVRMLGHHPIDALDSDDVARIYLASHVLLNEGGEPFQEIVNELSPEEGPRFKHYLQFRGYHTQAPKNAAAARVMLLEIVDRAIESLEDMAGVFRELEKINLQTAGHRLSWDDTPEGERLRRYEMTCGRKWSRMFDLLLKIRRTGDELDIATIASLGRSLPTVTADAIDPSARFDADDLTAPDEPLAESAPSIEEPVPPIEEPRPPIEEPVPPIEANSARQNAPNEANSRVQETSEGHGDGHKGLRIDTPHAGRKPAAIGTTGKERSHPVLERVIGGGQPTLMNLTPIFGEQ